MTEWQFFKQIIASIEELMKQWKKMLASRVRSKVAPLSEKKEARE